MSAAKLGLLSSLVAVRCRLRLWRVAPAQIRRRRIDAQALPTGAARGRGRIGQGFWRAESPGRLAKAAGRFRCVRRSGRRNRPELFRSGQSQVDAQGRFQDPDGGRRPARRGLDLDVGRELRRHRLGPERARGASRLRGRALRSRDVETRGPRHSRNRGRKGETRPAQGGRQVHRAGARCCSRGTSST